MVGIEAADPQISRVVLSVVWILHFPQCNSKDSARLLIVRSRAPPSRVAKSFFWPRCVHKPASWMWKQKRHDSIKAFKHCLTCLVLRLHTFSFRICGDFWFPLAEERVQILSAPVSHLEGRDQWLTSLCHVLSLYGGVFFSRSQTT